MTTRRWGPERIANTTAAGDQSGARVAALAGGGFMVAWQDRSTAATPIRAQRFDATGAPVGAEITVSSYSRADSTIAVTGLAGGGFYVTWSEYDSFQEYSYIQGNVYAADGGFLRYQPVVFPFAPDRNPAMAPIAGGGVAVVWEGGGGGAALRLFGATGSGGAIKGVSKPSAPALSMAADTVDDWIVITSIDALGSKVTAAIYSSDGLQWDNASILATLPSVLSEIVDQQVTFLSREVFAVAWVLGEVVDIGQWRYTLNVTFADISGGFEVRLVPFGTTALVPHSAANLSLRAMVGLPAGGVAVAWEDADGVKLRALTAGGSLLGPEYRLAAMPGSDLKLAALPDGRLAVTWTGDGDEGDSDIHLQIIDPRNGTVLGTNAAETLYGHDLANDEISGLGGNDVLRGLRGDDSLWGGLGDDTLDGGRGGDDMHGGPGNDLYLVDSHDDAVFELWRQGNDTIQSSIISINLAYYPNVENVILAGEAGLFATGNAAGNILNGETSSGANILTGLGGNDTYIVGAGDTVVEAVGGGTDTVQSGTISLNLAAYSGIENIILTGALALSATGNVGANAIDGERNGAANVLTGLGGDDTYTVGVGDTVVEAAGGGTDTVQSATLSLNLAQFPGVENLALLGALPLTATGNVAGNIIDGAQNSAANILTGLGGNDVYVVGPGDTVVEAANSGVDRVDSALINVDLALYPNTEWLLLRGALPLTGRGTAGGDILDGSFNSAANVLTGLGGDDVYVVGAGDTVVEAPGGGTDRVQAWNISLELANFPNVENITLTGSAALNITGNANANVLTGNAGANTLSGFGGGDIFIGLGGTDTLVGGAGADRFRFLSPADSAVGANRDVIQGFNPAEGDRIDLAAIDANGALAGDPAFVFRGTAAFNGPGQLRYDVAGADVILQGTLAGAVAQFEIRIAGIGALAAGDFLL